MNGQQLADTGIEQARQHAEIRIHDWTDRILEELMRWSEGRRQPFAIEDFRRHVEHNKPDLIPPSPNAWGSVSRNGIARRLIRFTGHYRAARSPATHGHPVRTFVRAS